MSEGIHVWNSPGKTLLKSDFPPKEAAILLLERDVAGFRGLYFPWERVYDGVDVLLYSRLRYWMAPVATILYLLFVWLGPKWMAAKKPYNLRTPLKYWNLLLAIFSACGSVRVLPHMAVYLWKFGLHSSMCAPPVFAYGRGAVGFWTMLFIYSKFLELLDTVFIVLRKRKLTFLHWYHHATVLLYTWDAFVTEQPPGIYYCGMNYFVHSIMYFYYFLSGVQSKPPKWGMVVTILQIAQMIVGVMVTATSLFNAFTLPFMYRSTTAIAKNPQLAGTCFVSKSNMLLAAAMYSTYFYLFADFFVKRYLKTRSTAARVKGE